MIKNGIEFAQEVLNKLKERGFEATLPEGFSIPNLPYYYNQDSEESEYLKVEDYITVLHLLVEQDPEVKGDLINAIQKMDEDFTLFTSVHNNQDLVSAIVDYDSKAEDPMFGDIADFKWAAFLDDNKVVAHLQETRLVYFDYNQGVGIYFY